MDMTDFHTRLQRLSRDQRAALAQRLAASNAAQRLVAYVVGNAGQVAPTPDSLRGLLKLSLPDYMIPAQWVMMEALPRLPNGKLNHAALPEPGAVADDAPAGVVAPRNPAEEALAQIWARVLNTEMISIHDNFFEIGGDSLLSIQIVAKARQAGLQISPKQVFDHPTIAELAAVAGAAMAARDEQGPVTGPLPLTPIHYWLLEQPLRNPQHWNQAVLLRSVTRLDPALVRETLMHWLRQHDALRTRFWQAGGRWQAEILPMPAQLPVDFVDLTARPGDEHAAAIEAAANAAHRSLSLARGQLVRVVHFDLGAELGSRLLLVIHHLATDGLSWRVLLEDWSAAHEQLAQGRAVQLPAKTTSFPAWSRRLTEYAQSSALDSEVNYWLASGAAPVTPLPRDDAEAANVFGAARRVAGLLPEAETRLLLGEALKSYRLTVPELLLTALAQTLTEWARTESVLLEVEGHGRESLFEGIDVSRTVGWFTSVYPVNFTLNPSAGRGEQILAVKERLRAVPNNGLGHGMLLHLRGDAALAAQLSAQPRAEVVFNYLGQSSLLIPASGSLTLASEPTGLARDPDDARRYLIEINSWIVSGQLVTEWTYAEPLYRRETIGRLSESYLVNLRSLIAHCLESGSGRASASDFALAGLDDDDFGQLAKLLEQAG
jgi:non-ribosomal peptide synthase protein (TIGR01720 family)